MRKTDSLAASRGDTDASDRECDFATKKELDSLRGFLMLLEEKKTQLVVLRGEFEGVISDLDAKKAARRERGRNGASARLQEFHLGEDRDREVCEEDGLEVFGEQYAADAVASLAEEDTDDPLADFL